MHFEFDPQKSLMNLQKHGIDFHSIQELWNDSDLLEIPARNLDEPRFLVIGRIEDKHWSCIITYQNDMIRIISARRARREEVLLYESA